MNMNDQAVGIYALETLNKLITQVEENEAYWPWIIITTHNALQSFLVCALKGSNNLRILRKRSMLRLIEEFARRTEYNVNEWEHPKEELDVFPSLFEKAQSDAMLFYTISKKLEPTSEQIKNIKKLHSLRNELIHFIPSFWELNIQTLPVLIKDSVDIIKFLVNESGNITWAIDEYKQKAQELVGHLTTKAQNIIDNN